MSTFFKRTIAFTNPQMSALKKEADKLGISIAELIRRIVDEYYGD